MAVSTLTTTKMLVPSSKFSIKCPYAMIPEEITYHETANDASAMSEVSYMIGNDNQVSFHFAVDDYRAVQGIEENRNTWNSGDGLNGRGNRKSIAIECCYSKSGGEKFTKARDNAITLIAMKLNQYGWGVDKVFFHQNRSGKYCPHRTLSEGFTLEQFRTMVQKRYDEMYMTSTNVTTLKVESYSGYVQTLIDKLSYRSKPSWDESAIKGTVDKGTVLTIKGRIKVDGVYMYQTKAGWYITSATQYIKFSTTNNFTSTTTTTTSNSKKYLNLFPTVDERTVYNASLAKVGTIKPKKYGGLSYLILGYTNGNRYVRIKTTTYGEVRICVDKNTVGDQFSITTSPKYK